jgi:hypothetical protein
MTHERKLRYCPECERGVDRREFLTYTGAAAFAVAGAPILSRSAFAAPTKESAAEVAVKELFASLDDAQRKIIALSLDDARRTKISANWNITDTEIGAMTDAQQELVKRVVQGVTSESGYEKFLKQMDEDSGGIEQYSIAIFGDPNKEQFQFELTGRHLTLRADGNTLGGAAFGGPIVYGHSVSGNNGNNLFNYQTKRANEVFKALDEAQRKKALLEQSPSETDVLLRKEGEALRGISGKELSADQRGLVEAVLRDIFAPYRQEDVDEAMEVIQAGGGIESLSLSFYSQEDLGGDKEWDIWRIEGPTLVTHFRGAPHVHAYINVARREG